jgi:hypothetical protein
MGQGWEMVPDREEMGRGWEMGHTGLRLTLVCSPPFPGQPCSFPTFQTVSFAFLARAILLEFLGAFS